jgi:PST family polysaccharide transporter
MKLLTFFHKQFSSVFELLSNAFWLLSAELLAKISRIFTVVVLAAQLSATSYGTAMLALAFHDVFGLLLRAGVGSQIINCSSDKLAKYARNGIFIQWAICLFIAFTQFSSANYFAAFTIMRKLQHYYK